MKIIEYKVYVILFKFFKRIEINCIFINIIKFIIKFIFYDFWNRDIVCRIGLRLL